MAAMTMGEYLRATSQTEAGFARRAGLSQRSVNRVCRGRGCNARTALAIIQATMERPAPGGRVVTLKDLVEGEEAAA